jgi:hypothetical protein
MTLGAKQVVVPDQTGFNRPASDRIEILSVDLLDQNRALVEDLKRLAKSLNLEFGWHYLLDLSWILSLLGDVDSLQVMDAGAGTGILQWYSGCEACAARLICCPQVVLFCVISTVRCLAHGRANGLSASLLR